VRRVLARVDQPPVLSPMVLAEIDYMVLTALGVDKELSVIDDLTSGAYDPADLDADDLRSGRELVARYRDLKIGLTDAVNVVLADRHATNEILTTDQRHYRTLVPLSRRHDAFRLLPLDL
jgi:predicted nucleic acid-binding protein